MNNLPGNHVIGQIISAQNILHVFDAENRLADFLLNLLESIPSVEKCGVCFDGILYSGSLDCGRKCCLDRINSNGVHDSDATHYECVYDTSPDFKSVPFSTLERTYGHFIIFSNDRRTLDSYLAFIQNLANSVALNVENKRQRVQLKQEISDLEKTRKELKQSEEKYRTITENMADIITVMDMDLNFTYISPSIVRLRGFTVEETMEQRIDKIMTPESFQRLSDVFAEELHLEQTGQADPERFRILELEEYKKDGSIIWVENKASFIHDEDQKPVGILVVSRDITDRKKAEQALRTSNERFLTVLDSIDATIYVTDMQSYEILFMNKYMINIFGRDMTGEECWKVYRGESGPCSLCPNDRLVDDNGNPKGVYTWQDRNPITEKWYINYDRAIEWTDGRLVKIQIATDITEMKHMEDQLRQAHKMESIGTLAGGIAHEFNNLLGIIIGNAELAFDDIADWNPAKDSLNEIKTASLRAKDVVRKLLSVARKMPESRKPIPIGSVLKESLDLMRRTIPATIDIRRNIACSTEMILGDPTEINQVLINLCTNSVHAMTEESGVLEVSLDTKQLNRESVLLYEDLEPGDYVRLTVKDTGKGIEASFMDRLFDPYFTTKDIDQGLGMGLAVVHGIVKKHDGAIKIESEVGKGTIVEVLFPLIEKQTETSTVEIESLRIGTERILLVDDEPSIVKMITQMLKRSGYEVIGKTSSASALKAFGETPEQFDLVISDMAMPEMAGDRLAQKIKQIRPEIPVILCTGHSDHIDESKAKERGIEALIMKPFQKEDIANTVRKVLDEAKG